MSKEEKLKKQAEKIAAKQAKLYAKKVAKDARKNNVQQPTYVHTESDEGSGAWRDDSAIRNSVYNKPSKPKKPIYKHWWFYLILVIFILIAIAFIGNLLSPSISNDFKLGKTATVNGLNFKTPYDWKISKSNTTTKTYQCIYKGDAIGDVTYSYIGQGDHLTKSQAKSMLAIKGAKNIEYSNPKVSNAFQSIEICYTYNKNDTDYAVNGFLIQTYDDAIFGVLVETKGDTTMTDSEQKTVNQIVSGIDLKNYKNPITLESISATYYGPTKAGTYIGDDDYPYNTDFNVMGKYSDGSTSQLKYWRLLNSGKLVAGESKTFSIKYLLTKKDIMTKVTVECSTLSKAQYMDKCNTYDYSNLSHHSTDSLYGKKIKVTGKVIQVIDTGEYMIDASSDYDFGHYVYIKTDGTEGKIVEDDTVTVYGTVAGDYSYQTVLGVDKTIPEITAKYISR